MKKKILFIHKSLNGGGAERVLIELLKNFDYSKYNVDLLTIVDGGVYFNQLPKEVYYLGSVISGKRRPKYKSLLLKMGFANLYEKKEIKRKVKKQYDVIISFMENLPLKYHYYVTKHARRNLTWVHTDFSVNHWSMKDFFSIHDEKKRYALMDEIICVSSTVKESMDQYLGYSNKTTVIYNVIDGARIREQALEKKIVKNGFTICSVGSLIPVKNHMRLLEAAVLLRKKEIKFTLWILGTGFLEPKLKQFVVDNDLNNNVSFLGFQSNPYPYIAASDILVLSSNAEGFPTVVCEAMILGRGVVSTNVSGSDELIGLNKYGILTEKNPNAIADAISEMMINNILENKQKMALERSYIFNVSKSLEYIYNRL